MKSGSTRVKWYQFPTYSHYLLFWYVIIIGVCNRYNYDGSYMFFFLVVI